MSSGKSLTIRDYVKIICDEIGYDERQVKWDTSQFVGTFDKTLVNTYLKDYYFISPEVGIKETIEYINKTHK